MQITELSNHLKLKDTAINYFWKCWGSDSNYIFYKDCILHSLNKENPLPKFYIGLLDGELIGSYALVTNDIISRQDLMPWLACLFVNEEHRNKGYGGRFLQHGLQEAHAKGFSKLYLSTDLIGFYEKKGWGHKCQGYGVGGDEFKVYEKDTF